MWDYLSASTYCTRDMRRTTHNLSPSRRNSFTHELNWLNPTRNMRVLHSLPDLYDIYKIWHCISPFSKIQDFPELFVSSVRGFERSFVISSHYVHWDSECWRSLLRNFVRCFFLHVDFQTLGIGLHCQLTFGSDEPIIEAECLVSVPVTTTTTTTTSGLRPWFFQVLRAFWIPVWTAYVMASTLLRSGSYTSRAFLDEQYTYSLKWALASFAGISVMPLERLLVIWLQWVCRQQKPRQNTFASASLLSCR